MAMKTLDIEKPPSILTGERIATHPQGHEQVGLCMRCYLIQQLLKIEEKGQNLEESRKGKEI